MLITIDRPRTAPCWTMCVRRTTALQHCPFHERLQLISCGCRSIAPPPARLRYSDAHSSQGASFLKCGAPPPCCATELLESLPHLLPRQAFCFCPAVGPELKMSAAGWARARSMGLHGQRYANCARDCDRTKRSSEPCKSKDDTRRSIVLGSALRPVVWTLRWFGNGSTNRTLVLIPLALASNTWTSGAGQW